MKKAIIGKKVGMTQIFDEMGKVIPVTVIEAGLRRDQKMTAERKAMKPSSSVTKKFPRSTSPSPKPAI